MTMIDDMCYSVFTGDKDHGRNVQELSGGTSVCRDDFIPNNMNDDKDYKKSGTIIFFFFLIFGVSRLNHFPRK